MLTSLNRPIIEAYWLGYVETQGFGGKAMDLDQIPIVAPVDVVKIAFYNIFPANSISFCFGMQFNHQWAYTQNGIKELQAKGIKVLASLNSTPDPDVGWNDIPDPQVFSNNVKSLIIDGLGFDGIDIDNECPEAPNENFENVITALREILGSDHLLTYVTYIPERDLPWLSKVGSCFDWVSTMAYWLDTQGQIDLFTSYANLLGKDKVLIGICCSDECNTNLQTVKEVCQWIKDQGPTSVGGIMVWNLSAADNISEYYGIIKNIIKKSF